MAVHLENGDPSLEFVSFCCYLSVEIREATPRGEPSGHCCQAHSEFPPFGMDFVQHGLARGQVSSLANMDMDRLSHTQEVFERGREGGWAGMSCSSSPRRVIRVLQLGQQKGLQFTVRISLEGTFPTDPEDLTREDSGTAPRSSWPHVMLQLKYWRCKVTNN